MKIIDLIENRQPDIVFHGTSSVFLKSILKRGVIASSPNQTFDNNGSILQRSLKSVGGSYWAFDYGTAKLSAYRSEEKHGGFPIIVIAQMHRNSALADEDSINLIGIFNRFDAIWFDDWNTEKAAIAFAKFAHDQLTRGNSNPPINENALIEAYWAELNRQEAYAKNHNNINNAEQRLATALDKLSRYYKISVYDPKHKEFQPIRYDKDITYKGKIRILAIVDLDLNVLYGKLSHRIMSAIQTE